jgi:spermidine/putrescine transport system permease protein
MRRSLSLPKRAYLLGAFLFLYLPLLVVIVQSFNASRYGTRWAGFTLRWYGELAGNDLLMQAALNTLLVAAIAATCATALGTLAAVAFYRYRFPGRGALHALLFVGMVSPDIVMAISLLILFVALHVGLGFWSLLVSHVTFCIPFVAVTVMSRLRGFDPRMVEAAMDLGAGEWRTFRAIILPLVFPAVAAGWMLSFTLSVDDVVVSFFTTGPTFEVLPLRIYSMVRLGVKPEVNALAAMLFLIPLVFVTASQLLLKEERK